MDNYNLIVVLGSQPDPKTWKFPEQIYDCLDKAKKLLDSKVAPYVAVCGKWGLAIENMNLRQPFRECDAMADYLLRAGVPADKILREGQSKDTISNLYYLKTTILIPRHTDRLVFVVAEFRIPRLRFLCEQILGPEYDVKFLPIVCEVGSTYNEPNTFRVQKEFLELMVPGDHTWLADKLYTAPMYKYWARHDTRMAKQ